MILSNLNQEIIKVTDFPTALYFSSESLDKTEKMKYSQLSSSLYATFPSGHGYSSSRPGAGTNC